MVFVIGFMISFSVLVFASSLVGSVLAGLVLSIHLMYDRPLKQAYDHLSWQTVKVVVAALVASNAVNAVSYFQPQDMFTPFIYSLEGSAVAFFQSFTHPILTILLIVAYLIAYPVLVVLTYLRLHSLDAEAELNYVGSYVVIILASAPFFHFLPVEVTGYYLEGVKPLLYEFHPIIHDGITSFDPLTKALPSLHTGISVLALCYSLKYTEKYKWYATLTTGTIILSTFYLGVHWITDAVLGAVMAVLSFYLVDSGIIGSSRVPENWKNRIRQLSEEVQIKITKI